MLKSTTEVIKLKVVYYFLYTFIGFSELNAIKIYSFNNKKKHNGILKEKIILN